MVSDLAVEAVLTATLTATAADNNASWHPPAAENAVLEAC
jgi:hypothetical protein